MTQRDDTPEKPAVIPGQTDSLWREAQPPPPRDDTAGVTSAEVCVVGAGIAGLTAAWLLAREGRRVVVLDDGPVGGGETGQTTAHLSPVLRERYFDLEKMHGEEGARAIAGAHRAAVDIIEETAAREFIDCDFERLPGYLVLGKGDGPEVLQREYGAAVRAGLPVDAVDDLYEGGFHFGPALRFPMQARFHPLKYVNGLAAAIQRRGGSIADDAHVVAIRAEGEAVVVELANGRTVTARDVVVATNSPIHTMLAYHTKIAPYRTYVVALRAPRGTFASLVWDTEDPYHYVRSAPAPSEDEEYVIVGGEDHKSGQAEDFDARYQALVRWARERFPRLGEVAWRWSGQVMESVDGVGYIGKSAGEEHVWVITGDSGNGLTNGTLGARIVADGILGRENAWAKTFDAGRPATRNVTEWVKEQANVAAQYADWLRGGDVPGVADIAPGSGAVLTHRLKQLAVYRHDDGTLSACSAVCPHAGCIVAWNGDARSWDCPCHGSRFDARGEVLNGPAVQPLSTEVSLDEVTADR